MISKNIIKCEKQKTYYINPMWLKGSILKNKLKCEAWSESKIEIPSNPKSKYNTRSKTSNNNTNIKSIDFVWTDGARKSNPHLWDIQTELKNDINMLDLDDKWKLYKIMKGYGMPFTCVWKSYTKLIPNKLYILKPVCSGNGTGLRVLWGKDIPKGEVKYNFIKEMYDEVRNTRFVRRMKNHKVIISEYIPNLLLCQNKVFHVRLYFIPSLINNEIKFYLTKFGKIITANKDYDIKKIQEKDVFDSHMQHSTKDLFFPEDLPLTTKIQLTTKEQHDKIYLNIINIMKHVSEVAKTRIRKFAEIKNGFSLFGVDLMIDQDLKIYLIEINGSKTGLKDSKDSRFSQKIFDLVEDLFINPLFHKKPSQRNDLYTCL